MLTISVVVSSFNSPWSLERSLASLAEQQFAALEVIVVDSGDPDSTRVILSKFAPSLTNLRLHCCDRQDDALATAFDQARGEVIGWLPAGETYAPVALEAVAGIFACLPKVEWLSSVSLLPVDPTGAFLDFQKLAGFSRESFLDGLNLPGAAHKFTGYIRPESTFWRRSLWVRSAENHGPNNALQAGRTEAPDFSLWARFFRHSRFLYCTACALGCSRLGPDRAIDREHQGYQNASRNILERIRADVGYRPDGLRERALAWKVPALPYVQILPKKFLRYVISLYEYSGRGIVRRSRGSAPPVWDIVSFQFYEWATTTWNPHRVD